METDKMISIIFSTNRKEPKFWEWFMPSLLSQISDDDKKNIEVICISYDIDVFAYKDYTETFYPEIECNGVKVIQSQPKPNVYQGKERKTKTEMFSPSNARNTGILVSQGNYLVFADDVSLLMPGWWFAVKQAAEKGMIVCGAYQKHFEMVVESGNLVSSRSHQGGIDSRWNIGNNGFPVAITGQQLFGCSFGIPAKDIIDVNGFDEICDSIGGEDYQLGMRLNNAGKKIWYDRRMFTVESEELHNQPYLMLRDDRVLSPEAYRMRLAEFGVDKRHTTGNYDSSHMILDILLGLGQTWTLGNNYNLGVDREAHYFVPPADVTNHWFDRKLLSEL